MKPGSLKRKTVCPASSPELAPIWEAEREVTRGPRVRREQAFLTDLKKSFEDEGAFFYKIADMPHVAGLRFDIEKPFDAFAVYGKRRFAIEAKALKGMQAFGIRHLRFCQEVGLDSFIAAGGESWVFVSVDDRAIPLEWGWLNRRLKAASLKKAELALMPYIPRVKGRYDLAAWLTKTKT